MHWIITPLSAYLPGICMQDEEVLSLVYIFFRSSVPCWTEIQFSLIAVGCKFWNQWNWWSTNLFFRIIVDWYTGFNFSFNICRIIFWHPFSENYLLANQIGFVTEKYVSMPSVFVRQLLLAICCAYLIINSSTCLGLGLHWVRTEVGFTPKRSNLRWV